MADERREQVEVTPTERAALEVVRKAIAKSGHNLSTDHHRFTVAITYGRHGDTGLEVGTTIADSLEEPPVDHQRSRVSITGAHGTDSGSWNPPARSQPLLKKMARDAGRELEAHGRKLHEGR